MTKTEESSTGSLFNVVAIAASSGGLEPLIEVISGLPANFPASVLVVLHSSPGYKSHLPEILGRCTPLKVKEAEEGEKLAKATIYTARPGKHMMVNADGTLSLGSTGRVQFARPAADVLFVTLAISCTCTTEKAIAVVLSGSGRDGAMGTLAKKRSGGKVIAQEDPKVPGMPEATILVDDVDFILPSAKIALMLTNLVKQEKPVPKEIFS